MRKRQKKKIEQQAKRPASHVLSAIAGQPWAITAEALEQILEIANRENLPIEAIEAEMGRPLENTRTVTVRDGVATIPVIGPLFRYANLFTRISGATAYETVANDLNQALADSTVRAILLEIDSPGGQVTGVIDLAQMIREARDIKPVVAHVEGLGASGGYAIASGAGRIVASSSALLGSVGVVLTVTKDPEEDPQTGVKTFELVSSQSPNKRPDIESEDGRAQVQTLVDDLADVLINAVATNRGVTAEEVLAYGQGAVLVGQKAVDAGLADDVGTFEEVHSQLVADMSSQDTSFALSARRSRMGLSDLDESAGAEEEVPTGPPATTEEPEMAETKETPVLTAGDVKEQHPEVAKALASEGNQAAATAERERLLGIDALAEAGHEKLLQECKEDSGCSVADAALRMKMADKKQKDAALAGLKVDEKNLDAPTTTEPGAEDQDSPAAEAAKVLSIHSKLNGRRTA